MLDLVLCVSVQPSVSEDNQSLVTVQLTYECLDSCPSVLLPIRAFSRVRPWTVRVVGILFLSCIVVLADAQNRDIRVVKIDVRIRVVLVIDQV